MDNLIAGMRISGSFCFAIALFGAGGSATTRAAPAVAATPICKIENARYRQRFAPSITARFQDVDSGPDWPSRVALLIHVAKTNRSYWWLPWAGGSNGEQNLASTTDVTAPGWSAPSPDDGRQRPLGNVDYLAVNAAYDVLHDMPLRGGPAPAHFFIHDLREALWYRTPSEKRDDEARQFFDLVSCAS